MRRPLVRRGESTSIGLRLGNRIPYILVGPGRPLEYVSERVQELLGRMNGPLQRGFYTHRVLDEIGVEKARSALSVLEGGLADALGHERAELLVRALMRELDRSEERIRHQIEQRLEALAHSDDGPMVRPFADLSEDERKELAGYAAKHGLANLCRVLFNSNEFLFVD